MEKKHVLIVVGAILLLIVGFSGVEYSVFVAVWAGCIMAPFTMLALQILAVKDSGRVPKTFKWGIFEVFTGGIALLLLPAGVAILAAIGAHAAGLGFNDVYQDD